MDAIGFGMSVILQDRRLYDPFAPRPFPRGLPVGEDEWLLFDDAFAAQMVERQRLISQARPDVIALQDRAVDAANELLDRVLTLSGDHFDSQPDEVHRGHVGNLDCYAELLSRITAILGEIETALTDDGGV